MNIRWWILGSLVIIIIAAVATLRDPWPSLKYTTIAKLNCGRGQVIVLSADRFPDPAPLLYYQVFEYGQEIIPITMAEWYREFGIPTLARMRELQYTVVSTTDGQLFGVTTKELPQELLLMHDFATHLSWPHQFQKYNIASEESLGSISDGRREEQKMRARLEADHPPLRKK